jgi:hypothetical protein
VRNSASRKNIRMQEEITGTPVLQELTVTNCSPFFVSSSAPTVQTRKQKLE